MATSVNSPIVFDSTFPLGFTHAGLPAVKFSVLPAGRNKPRRIVDSRIGRKVVSLPAKSLTKRALLEGRPVRPKENRDDARAHFADSRGMPTGHGPACRGAPPRPNKPPLG